MNNLQFSSLALLFVLFSCNDDTPGDQDPVESLLTIQGAPPAPEFEHMYFIVTDINNEIVLGYFDVDTTQEFQEVIRPEGFEDERFNFHILVIYPESLLPYDHFEMISYHQILPQTFDYRREPFIDNSFNVTVNFVNIPENYGYEVSHRFGPIGGTRLSENETMNFSADPANDWVYLLLNTYEGKKYKIIKLNGEANQQVDLSEMSSSFVDVTIDVPADYFFQSVSIEAYKDKITSGGLTIFNGGTQSLNYPADSEFSNFITEVNLKFDYLENKSIIYQEIGVPNSITPFDTDIDLINFSPDAIQFDLKGSFDYYRFDMSHSSDNEFYRWAFTGKDQSIIAFPGIPGEITTLYPHINSNNLINSRASWRIKDYEHLESYDEYIELINSSTIYRPVLKNEFTRSVEVLSNNY